MSGGKIRWLLRKTVEMMTSIPTVIYGFVGIFLLVRLVREFFSTGSGMCVRVADDDPFGFPHHDPFLLRQL